MNDISSIKEALKKFLAAGGTEDDLLNAFYDVIDEETNNWVAVVNANTFSNKSLKDIILHDAMACSQHENDIMKYVPYDKASCYADAALCYLESSLLGEAMQSDDSLLDAYMDATDRFASAAGVNEKIAKIGDFLEGLKKPCGCNDCNKSKGEEKAVKTTVTPDGVKTKEIDRAEFEKEWKAAQEKMASFLKKLGLD